MSKGNDHLFQLIKTLSSTEKRYFKRNALVAKDAHSNYLKLYDTLNKMEVYDEVKVKKKPFVKHLASEKKYLYEAILKSLRNYNKDESIRAQIFDLLLDADYLFQRGMYDQEEKRLKKAERLAEEIQDLTLLLEVNHAKRKMLRLKKPKSFSKDLEKLLLEKDKLLVGIKQELTLADLKDKLHVMVLKSHSLENEEERQKVKATFLEKLKSYSESELPLNAVRNKYMALAFYYVLMNDFKNIEKYLEKIFSWWEQNPAIRRQKFEFYINAVSNYLFFLIQNKKFDLALDIFSQFDKIPLSSFHYKKAAFEKSSIWKILFYFSQNDLESIANLIPEISKSMNYYYNSDSPNMTLNSNIVLFYFLMEDWEECKIRIEKILVAKRIEQREGILRLLRIIFLITYFELGKIEKVETLLRSVQRYFEKTLTNKQGYEFELLKWFKELINTPILEEKEFFKKFKIYLNEKGRLDKSKNTLLAFEELNLWIDHRLEKVSIKEIHKRKFEGN